VPSMSKINKRFLITGNKRSSGVTWYSVYCILARECLIGQRSTLSVEALRLYLPHW
jgi:hypothetical protein